MDALINVNGENVQTLQILFLTTIITLLPSMLVMMTSFTRYIISFSFLRSALGLQQNPPNMVLIGMALFLTLFTMSPVLNQIQTQAYEPYVAEVMTQPAFSSSSVETVTVPEGEIFVMGDNRNHSSDSRHPNLGTVDLRCVLGKAQAVLFPLSHLQTIH